MSLFMRIIFFGLAGIIAGILSWPFTELVIYDQETFGTLLLFNIVLGISVGLFMGACFGASEGLISVSKEKVKNGIIMGTATGVIGGLAGFVSGQAALLYIGTTFFNSNLSFQRIGIPVSRAIAWAHKTELTNTTITHIFFNLFMIQFPSPPVIIVYSAT